MSSNNVIISPFLTLFSLIYDFNSFSYQIRRANVDVIVAENVEASSSEDSNGTEDEDLDSSSDDSDNLVTRTDELDGLTVNSSMPKGKRVVVESPTRKAMRLPASTNMKKAAVKMNKNRGPVQPILRVGDIVTIGVHKVDRGPCDPLRVPGVVVEVTEGNQYRIGFRAGVLKTCLPRNAVVHKPNAIPFSFGLQNVLNNWRTMKKIGVRTAAALESPTGGQGFVKCSCKKIQVQQISANVSRRINYVTVGVIKGQTAA